MTGANDYTGTTLVQLGTLQAGVATVVATSGAFGLNSAVTVLSGATLDTAGFNNSVGSLAGGGNVTLGSATLTAGGADSGHCDGILRGDQRCRRQLRQNGHLHPDAFRQQHLRGHHHDQPGHAPNRQWWILRHAGVWCRDGQWHIGIRPQ